MFDSCTLATTRDFSTTLDASHATRRWKLSSTYWQDAASPDAAYPARFGTTYEVFSWQRETCSRSTTTPNRLGAARPSRQRPSPCVKASVQSLCWPLGCYANTATIQWSSALHWKHCQQEQGGSCPLGKSWSTRPPHDLATNLRCSLSCSFFSLFGFWSLRRCLTLNSSPFQW
jgi:hypothetical protein